VLIDYFYNTLMLHFALLGIFTDPDYNLLLIYEKKVSRLERKEGSE